jgi:hypothetical protein
MPEVMNANMEKNFFTYILENPNQFSKVEPYFFKNENIQFVYTVVREEYLSTKEKPSLQQIVDMVKLHDPDNKTPNEALKIILKNDISEKREWVENKFKAWKLSNYIKESTSKTIDEIRNLKDIDIDNVKSVYAKIKNLYNNIPLIDDDEDLGDDFEDPNAHKQEISKYKIPSGWTSVDKILSGGWDMATFNVLMGETNVGKCCKSDSYIKIRNKKDGRILYITYEDFFNNVK